jgi:hypothetical protein
VPGGGGGGGRGIGNSISSLLSRIRRKVEDFSVSLLDSLWFSVLNAGGGRGAAEQQKTFLFLSSILFGF